MGGLPPAPCSQPVLPLTAPPRPGLCTLLTAAATAAPVPAGAAAVTAAVPPDEPAWARDHGPGNPRAGPPSKPSCRVAGAGNRGHGVSLHT